MYVVGEGCPSRSWAKPEGGLGALHRPSRDLARCAPGNPDPHLRWFSLRWWHKAELFLQPGWGPHPPPRGLPALCPPGPWSAPCLSPCRGADPLEARGPAHKPTCRPASWARVWGPHLQAVPTSRHQMLRAHSQVPAGDRFPSGQNRHLQPRSPGSDLCLEPLGPPLPVSMWV